MNREIKFRAWDKKRNKFHWGIGNLQLSLSGHLMWQFGFEAPTVLSPEEQEDYVLQQFTGLKDRNGKDIYEGDIVNMIPTGFSPIPAVVKITTRGIIFHRTDNDTGHYGADWIDVEVIGNIYENKDLLK